jgi:hypothetical protein
MPESVLLDVWDARSSRTPGEWRRPSGHLWLAPDASRLAHRHGAMRPRRRSRAGGVMDSFSMHQLREGPRETR